MVSMKKMNLLLCVLAANTIIMLSVFSNPAVKKTCSDIASCLELSSRITGTKYIYGKDIKGKINFSKNFVINKTNVDRTISQVLYTNGYTRIPSGENTFQIISARDIRYTPVPTFEIFKDKIPENHDYFMANYKLKNPYIVNEIVRNFRPFMSRYGRILDVKKPGMIIITDTGKNINRLAKLITFLDKDLNDDEKEQYEERNEKRRKLELVKTKNCSHLEAKIDKLEMLISKK